MKLPGAKTEGSKECIYSDAADKTCGGPWPVLLYVHGGSWFEGDKAEGAGWREQMRDD
jgi:acetyl esterase/lipase